MQKRGPSKPKKPVQKIRRKPMPGMRVRVPTDAEVKRNTAHRKVIEAVVFAEAKRRKINLRGASRNLGDAFMAIGLPNIEVRDLILRRLTAEGNFGTRDRFANAWAQYYKKRKLK